MKPGDPSPFEVPESLRAAAQRFMDAAHSPRKDHKPVGGVIYVAKLEGFWLYKIGVTWSSTKVRMMQLNSCAPFAVSLVAAEFVADARYFEELLHARFQDKHHRGEWFRLNRAEVKDLVARLKAMRTETSGEAFAEYLKRSKEAERTMYMRPGHVLYKPSVRYDRDPFDAVKE